MYKWIGSLLIIAAGAGMGWLKGADLQKRLTAMQSLRQIFLMLRSEIQYTKAPLGEAFWRIGRRTDGIYGAWLKKLAERLGQHSETSFRNIWIHTAEESLTESGLSQEDVEYLKAAGEQMGYLDERMQLGTIDLFLEQLESEIREQRRTIAEKGGFATASE